MLQNTNNKQTGTTNIATQHRLYDPKRREPKTYNKSWNIIAFCSDLRAKSFFATRPLYSGSLGL